MLRSKLLDHKISEKKIIKKIHFTQIESALRSPCMMSMEPDYRLIFNDLEKLAADFIKEDAKRDGHLTQTKIVLAPIYDGSELELIDEDDPIKDESPESESSQELAAGQANGEKDSASPDHKPLQKTVTLNVPESNSVRSKPRPLKKRFTVGVINVGNPAARIEVGGMAESASSYHPSRWQFN